LYGPITDSWFSTLIVDGVVVHENVGVSADQSLVLVMMHGINCKSCWRDVRKDSLLIVLCWICIQSIIRRLLTCLICFHHRSSKGQPLWLHLTTKFVFTGLYRLFVALGRLDIYENGLDEWSKYSDPVQGVNTPHR
jgi:hypothetical protein